MRSSGALGAGRSSRARTMQVVVLTAALSMLLAFGVGRAWAATGYEHLGGFSGPGAGDGQLAAPKRVAVEWSTGRVLVVDQGNDRVQVFEPSGGDGSYLTQFGTGVLDDPFGIAIDQDSGDV